MDYFLSRYYFIDVKGISSYYFMAKAYSQLVFLTPALRQGLEKTTTKRGLSPEQFPCRYFLTGDMS